MDNGKRTCDLEAGVVYRYVSFGDDNTPHDVDFLVHKINYDEAISVIVRSGAPGFQPGQIMRYSSQGDADKCRFPLPPDQWDDETCVQVAKHALELEGSD